MTLNKLGPFATLNIIDTEEMTLSITVFRIMTLSITTLCIMTLSIMDLLAALGIIDRINYTQHNSTFMHVSLC